MRVGIQRDYEWLVTDPGGITRLLSQCPTVLLGHEIAITSFDSGPLSPTPDEQSRGWNTQDEVLYVPSLSSVDLLPYDNYDEWYLFETPCRLPNFEVFITYGGFNLAPEPEVADYLNPILERFWAQLSRIRPESYVADGDFFVFATCNKKHFTTVKAAFG